MCTLSNMLHMCTFHMCMPLTVGVNKLPAWSKEKATPRARVRA